MGAVMQENVHEVVPPTTDSPTSEPDPPSAAPDRLRVWQWCVLILLSPLAGFIGWARWREHQPVKARLAITIAITVALLDPLATAAIRAYPLHPYVLRSTAMQPTIALNDRVLANKSAYLSTGPARGDVIVFVKPDDHTARPRPLIRRVVAIEGDAVELKNGRLVVNRQPEAASYAAGPFDPEGLGTLLTVPSGQVLLLEHDGNAAAGASSFGLQPISAIKGKVVFIYWPLGHAHRL